MKRDPFTPEQEQFIRDNRLKLSGRQLAEALGCSKTKVENFLRKHKITVPKEVSNKFRAAAHRGKTSWSKEQTEFLKKHYLELPEKALAKEIGKSSTSVRIRMKQLGLVIPPDLIEKRIKESRFSKGQRSWNKGKKQTDFMSPEKIENTKATRFKKGNKPHNTAEKDGAVSIRKDTKTGIPYKYIRVKLGHWELLQRNTWEKANGPIPEGYVIRFKDRNSMNCELENLEMVTLAENLEKNWHDFPQPLKKAIRLTNKLKKEL